MDLKLINIREKEVKSPLRLLLDKIRTNCDEEISMEEITAEVKAVRSERYAKEKIIIDTNLYISFLINQKLDDLVIMLEKNLIVILYSDELIAEIIKVTSKTKFQKYFTNDVVAY